MQPIQFVYQSPSFVDTPIYAGQTWNPSFYLFDQRAIKSTTPGTSTKITTFAPHGLLNGGTARVLISDKINTMLNGAWTVTLVDAYNFTIPVSSVFAGVANCGQCGAVVSCSGATLYYGLYDRTGTFVVSPTSNLVSGPNGEYSLTLTELQTKALASYSALDYGAFVRLSSGVFISAAIGTVPVITNPALSLLP